MRTFLATLLILTISPAIAEVNFAEFSVMQVITPQTLQAVSGTSSTAQVTAVAAYPETDGPLYVAHLDGEGHVSFLRVQVHIEGANWLTDSNLLSTHLGGPYTQDMRLFGGIVYSLTDNSIYFAENQNGGKGEASIIRINATSGLAQLVRRDQVMAELVDHTVLPNGTLLATRNGSGIKAIGTIDPAAGVWETRVDDAQLLAAVPGSGNLAPEAIAASSTTGAVYVFGAGDGETFRINDIAGTSPVVTGFSQSQVRSAVFSDITADQAGNLFGLDIAGQQVLVVRASDGAVFSLSLQQIVSSLGASELFTVTPLRGLAARAAGRGQTDLFMASSTPAYGVLRVRFGVHPAAVGHWELY